MGIERRQEMAFMILQSTEYRLHYRPDDYTDVITTCRTGYGRVTSDLIDRFVRSLTAPDNDIRTRQLAKTNIPRWCTILQECAKIAEFLKFTYDQIQAGGRAKLFMNTGIYRPVQCTHHGVHACRQKHCATVHF